MTKLMKKAVAMILMAAMTVTLLFQDANIVQAASGSTNEEIPEGYTAIYTIDDLAAINSNPKGNYILMNDIDMTRETSPGGSWDTGHGWTPLKSFSGTFDGNGHRIIGMHIYGNYSGRIAEYSDDPYGEIGLFSELHGRIVNLGVVDCDINVSSGSYIGGIVGNNYSGVVRNCYVSGTIQASNNAYIGGITGYLVKSSIYNCYNMAKLSGSKNGRGSYGGIAAGLEDDDFCEIYYSYNIGELPNKGYGIINGSNTIIEDNYYDNYYLNTTVSDKSDDYNVGKSLTATQMQSAGSFTGFDFENTWFIDKLSSYKYPQLRSCPQVRVEKMELTSLPDKVNYSQGDTLDLSGAVITLTYEDGVITSAEVEDDMVSAVDMNQAGTQTVTVSYLNESRTFDINIKVVEPSGITLSQKNCDLNRGDTVQLEATVTPSNASAQLVQWKSDNKVVATVDEDGVVRGINAGEATITATTANGITAKCMVSVKVPAVKMKISPQKLTLKKGRKQTLKVTLKPLETTDTVTWSSSNPKIASVNKKGVVKAKKKGYATILAETTSGLLIYIKVTVK